MTWRVYVKLWREEKLKEISCLRYYSLFSLLLCLKCIDLERRNSFFVEGSEGDRWFQRLLFQTFQNDKWRHSRITIKRSCSYCGKNEDRATRPRGMEAFELFQTGEKRFTCCDDWPVIVQLSLAMKTNKTIKRSFQNCPTYQLLSPIESQKKVIRYSSILVHHWNPMKLFQSAVQWYQTLLHSCCT